jgi:hypothetical protein
VRLACAERGDVDAFLTTDDALLSRARRPQGAAHQSSEPAILVQGRRDASTAIRSTDPLASTRLSQSRNDLVNQGGVIRRTGSAGRKFL